MLLLPLLLLLLLDRLALLIECERRVALTYPPFQPRVNFVA